MNSDIKCHFLKESARCVRPVGGVSQLPFLYPSPTPVCISLGFSHTMDLSSFYCHQEESWADLMDEEDDDREETRAQTKSVAVDTKLAASTTTKPEPSSRKPEPVEQPPKKEEPQPEPEARPLSILEIVRLSRGSKGPTGNIFLENVQQPKQPARSEKHNQRRSADINELDSWRRSTPFPGREDRARENNENVKQWHSYAEVLQKEYAIQQEEAKREFLRRTAGQSPPAPSPEDTRPDTTDGDKPLESVKDTRMNGKMVEAVVSNHYTTREETMTTPALADTIDTSIEKAAQQIEQLSLKEHESAISEDLAPEQSTSPPPTEMGDNQPKTASATAKVVVEKEEKEQEENEQRYQDVPKIFAQAELNEQLVPSEVSVPASAPVRPPTPPPVPDRADAWQAFAQQHQKQSLTPSLHEMSRDISGGPLQEAQNEPLHSIDVNQSEELEREEGRKGEEGHSQEIQQEIETSELEEMHDAIVADQPITTDDFQQLTTEDATDFITATTSTSNAAAEIPKQPEPVPDTTDRWRAFALEASKATNNFNASTSSLSSSSAFKESSIPILPQESAQKSDQPAPRISAQVSDDNDDSWKAAASWDMSAPVAEEAAPISSDSSAIDTLGGKSNGRTTTSQTLMTSPSTNIDDESWKAAAASWNNTQSQYSNATATQISTDSWPTASWNAAPQTNGSTLVTPTITNTDNSWKAANTRSWNTSDSTSKLSENADNSWRAAAAVSWDTKQQSRSTIQLSNDSDDSWKAAASWQDAPTNTILQPQFTSFDTTNNANSARDAWRKAAATWENTVTSSPSIAASDAVDAKQRTNVGDRTRAPRQGRRLQLQAFVNKELQQAGLLSGKK